MAKRIKNSYHDSVLVVGAGYVGLATAVFLAKKGCRVTVLEKNKSALESLLSGKLHFHEQKLKTEFKSALKNGNLQVSAPSRQHYEGHSLIIIAIDSVDSGNWRMKLNAFERMASWIGGVERKKKALVVLKSTNVLGFARLFRQILDKASHGDRVDLLVNPEFLREGLAYEDTAKPWRIVIGAEDSGAANALARFYQSMYPKSIPVIRTDWRSAELIKLGSNLYLAHRLAFINEIAEYARTQKLNVDKIREGIAADPRIGDEYISPGMGFGGSCLPKDCHLINSREAGSRYTFETAKTALMVNDLIVDGLVYRLRKQLGRLVGYRIAILGVTFKPGTVDTRGSRAVTLALQLRRRGVDLGLYDPNLKKVEKLSQGNLPLCADVNTAVSGASALVIGAAHRQFTSLKPDEIGGDMKQRLILDYFSILNRPRWEKAGFTFIDHG